MTWRLRSLGSNPWKPKGIVVTANQNRTLGQLKLEIGGVAESVNVVGEVSQVNLASAEKSGTINTSQLQNIAVKGRDFFALLNTVPGVGEQTNANFGRITRARDPRMIQLSLKLFF